MIGFSRQFRVQFHSLMPDPQQPSTSSDEGGYALGYPPSAFERGVHAAPSTAKEKNTVRMELTPVACWRLNHGRFAFGSSFLLPEAAGEFTKLFQIRAQHAGAPLSVFGHADPVGDDAFNKQLSGRRAMSVYAVITRDIDRWESLYTNPLGGDCWTDTEVDAMLASLGYTAGTRSDRVRAFQQADGTLTADGVCGPKTRSKLFPKYMDFLCRDLSGAPWKLTAGDFLAQGADAGRKGDVQGCSEFNPVLVFSQSENTDFNKPENKTKRDEENSVNRRVTILLFEKGTVIPPSKWPCPATAEGTTGCVKRFWSDADKRRNPQGERRFFDKTHDTFACRFYHRLTETSPCEAAGGGRTWVQIQLLDAEHQPRPNAPYKITAAGETLTGEADGSGKFLKILPLGSSEAFLESGGNRFNLKLEPLPPVEDNMGLKIRLVNLGYACGEIDASINTETEGALRSFQALHKLEETGEPNAATRDKVKSVYGG